MTAPDPEFDDLDRQARRLALITRWADDLAHEIKNPLHAMVINLELVKRRATAGNAEDAVSRAEVVESELHRVHQLVDSLLRLIRPWPDTGTTSVHEVFAALLPAIRARARILGIEFHHEGGEAIAALPPGDLAEALMVIIDDALASAGGGGRVATAITRAGDEAGTGDDAGTGARGDGVAVTIRRSGDAPDPAGASLALTRALLARAGGSIHVAVPEGGGAEVRVTLRPTGAA